MVYFLMADGFEEMEAIVPLDMLRRAKLNVQTASVAPRLGVTGAHGIKIECDMLAADIDPAQVEMLVLPGGGKGTENLDSSPIVGWLLQHAGEHGLPVAAICAAPSVLGKRGFLKGKNAVCFPGFEDTLKGALLSDKPVVRDGNILTAKAAGAAFEFGFALIALLLGKEAADQVRASIYY